MSRFVEISGATSGLSGFVDAERVEAVGVHTDGATLITTRCGGQMLVSGTPAEVVAKLQQPNLDELVSRITPENSHNVAAPPAESEAVQLLERWLWWLTEDHTTDTAPDLTADTTALLAKLKGGV